LRIGPRFLAVALFVAAPWLAGAQETDPFVTAEAPTQVRASPGQGLQPGESLRVSLITIGLGDAVWERFGHNALWIEDPETGFWGAYNWGVFDFGEVDFIPRLAKGTMLYRLEVFDPLGSLEGYRRADRPVWLQELNLTPGQKRELVEFVRWNALPENKYYRYDYYLDNCSTRIRDVLDDVLDHRIRDTFASDTTAHSFRWHARRLLGGVPWAYLGMQFLLGPRTDRLITRWETMFLPISLMEALRELEVPDETGSLRPLVAGERVLVSTSRPPEPQDLPMALPVFLAVGLLWALGILWATGPGPSASRLGRMGAVILAGGWSLLAGLGGSLLLLAWVFTDHHFWYENLNLFQANPFFLPIALAFFFFLFSSRLPPWSKPFARVVGILSILGAIVSFMPGIGQANGEILALTIPLNLALWRASVRLVRPSPSAGEATGE
jgi:hypothetical protein